MNFLKNKDTVFALIFLVLLFLLGVISLISLKGSPEVKIDVNPYNISPLAAVLNINTTKDTGYIKTIVHGKGDSGISIPNTVTHNKNEFQIELLGLYSNYNNRVTIKFYNDKDVLYFSEEKFIQTGEISNNISFDLDVKKNDLGTEYNGLYSFIDTPALFDQQGEVRWYLNSSEYGKIYIKLRNGNYIITSTRDKVLYHEKYFYEITALGEIIRSYSVNNFFHHDILELPNGNLLTSSSSESFSQRTDPVFRDDTVIEIDRITGKILEETMFNDIFHDMVPNIAESYLVNGDTELDRLQEGTSGDWLHINSLDYHEGDVIVSARNKSMVFSYGMNDKKLNWVLMDGYQNYSSILDFALELNFDLYAYPLVQHSATITDSGDLLLFDNGTGRSIKDGSSGNDYSRAIKYSIDTQDHTAEVFQYYIDNDLTYTHLRGSAFELDNGNVLVGYVFSLDDSNSKLVEYDSKGNIVLEIIDTTEGQYYRVNKFQLY